MGICPGSDMCGDTRYGDLDPHSTACQQVSGCLHGRRLHGRGRTCHSSHGVCSPRRTKQSREAKGPSARRYSRAWVTRTPFIGVVGAASSRARALRGRVSGDSGSAWHYLAPGLVAPSRTVKSFLLVTEKYLVRRFVPGWAILRASGRGRKLLSLWH
eukprot:351585-Chlamydomonas_euryale.AAC.1